jgi:hypothetical protein
MKNPGRDTVFSLKTILIVLLLLFLVSITGCKNPEEEPKRYPFQDIPLVEHCDPPFLTYSLYPG